MRCGCRAHALGLPDIEERRVASEGGRIVEFKPLGDAKRIVPVQVRQRLIEVEGSVARNLRIAFDMARQPRARSDDERRGPSESTAAGFTGGRVRCGAAREAKLKRESGHLASR